MVFAGGADEVSLSLRLLLVYHLISCISELTRRLILCLITHQLIYPASRRSSHIIHHFPIPHVRWLIAHRLRYSPF
jgi:hypothetical protein